MHRVTITKPEAGSTGGSRRAVGGHHALVGVCFDAIVRFAMLHCPTETGFDQQTNRILAQNYKLLLLMLEHALRLVPYRRQDPRLLFFVY